MSQLTTNTRAFIESEQYSAFVLRNLWDGLLPEMFYRDVSDFPAGETLHIKQVGTVSIQDVAENVALDYNAIDTSEVFLTITDYKGDAWFITDKLRQDGAQIDALLAERAAEGTRAIQEVHESKFLAVANAAQTPADPNAINGFPHRIVAPAAAGNIMTLDLFRRMKLSFDKAKVPAFGRIAIVDPVVEATLNGIFSYVSSVGGGTDNYNDMLFQGLQQSGFASEHQFIRNIMGWSVWTSNRLPQIASETVSTVAVTNGVANLFMCLADDNCKPMMHAWRQMPRTETERNKDLQRDEFLTTCRYGFGSQRPETLGVVLTSAVNY